VKKKETLVIPRDKVKSARRQARSAAGATRPSQVLTPKPLKLPKHKKRIEEDVD
jgi:hypothetical protein